MTDQLEMIDIHAHILPGIDDGARNWEETGRLLEAAWAQGVRHIIATPHFSRKTDICLLYTSMGYHLGKFGVIFIAVILWLFSFSTFLGILYYARSNVSYRFGDSWAAQTAYKVLALVMLFIGGLAAYTIVWDLGDVGVGLMTIFNLIALYPMAGEALASLKDYEEKRAKGVL